MKIPTIQVQECYLDSEKNNHVRSVEDKRAENHTLIAWAGPDSPLKVYDQEQDLDVWTGINREMYEVLQDYQNQSDYGLGEFNHRWPLKPRADEEKFRKKLRAELESDTHRMIGSQAISNVYDFDKDDPEQQVA